MEGLPKLAKDPFWRTPEQLGMPDAEDSNNRAIQHVGLTRKFELLMYIQGDNREYTWAANDRNIFAKKWRNLLFQELLAFLSPEKNSQIGFDKDLKIFVRGTSSRKPRLATDQEDEWYRQMLINDPKWEKHVAKHSAEVAAKAQSSQQQPGGNEPGREAYKSNETNSSGGLEPLPTPSKRVLTPLQELEEPSDEEVEEKKQDVSRIFDSPINGPKGLTSANEAKVRWRKRGGQPGRSTFSKSNFEWA